MTIKSVEINGNVYLEAKTIIKAVGAFSNAIGISFSNQEKKANFVNGDFPETEELKEVEKQIAKNLKPKNKMGRHAKDCACPKHKAKVEVAPVATKNGKEKEPVAA